MRDLWVDHGNGVLIINTSKLFVRLYSKARKNYHTVSSNWCLSVGVKGEYGFAVQFYHHFGGTFDQALERSETILKELFGAIQEIML